MEREIANKIDAAQKDYIINPPVDDENSDENPSEADSDEII